MSTTIYTEKNTEKKYNYVYMQLRDNDEFYIGIHSDDHLDDDYIGSGILFKKKYDSDPSRFTKTILFYRDTRQEVSDIEALLVTEKSIKNPLCLNLMPGGDNAPPSRKGMKLSAETKAKMSVAHKGKKKSAEHRANISAAQKGMKCSAETKAKISAALKGKKLSAEHLAKRSASRRDKTIYTFSHKGGDIFEGTRYELRQAFPEYKWNSGGLRRMITGRLKSHCGWSINICINLI